MKTEFKKDEFLLTTFDGYKVKENENVSWLINNKYKYELTLCEKHKDLIRNSNGMYKVFKMKDNALEYHNIQLLKEHKEESLQEKVNRLELELNQAKQELEDSKPKVGDLMVFNNAHFKFIAIVTTEDLHPKLGRINILNAEPLPTELQEQLRPYLDSFVLPEKWFTIANTREEKDILNKFVVDLGDNIWTLKDDFANKHTPHFENKEYHTSTYKGNEYKEVYTEKIWSRG